VQALKRRKQAELGVTAEEVSLAPSDGCRLRLEQAFDEFIANQELLGREKKTVNGYRAVKRKFSVLPASIFG
jgi:hypothetical protein